MYHFSAMSHGVESVVSLPYYLNDCTAGHGDVGTLPMVEVTPHVFLAVKPIALHADGFSTVFLLVLQHQV